MLNEHLGSSPVLQVPALIYEEEECNGDPFLLLLDHSLYSALIMSTLRMDHIQGSMSVGCHRSKKNQQEKLRKGTKAQNSQYPDTAGSIPEKGRVINM